MLSTSIRPSEVTTRICDFTNGSTDPIYNLDDVVVGD